MIAVIPLLAMLLMPGGASAARARHALPAKCAPSSHTLLADPQAQIYSTPIDIDGVISLRACVYGQRRSYIISGCNYEESAAVCAGKSHITLVGSVVAFGGTVKAEAGQEDEESIDEWHVEVRDLRTGRLLHEVPTGTPLKPAPHYVGVGPIVGLVLKSDGSVAWIAEDYERSSVLGRKPFLPSHTLICMRPTRPVPGCWPRGPTSIPRRWHSRSVPPVSTLGPELLKAARCTGRRAGSRNRRLWTEKDCPSLWTHS